MYDMNFAFVPNPFKADGMPVGGLSEIREDTTFYVSTSGSDDNAGLAAEVPFLTIQKAFDVIATLLIPRPYVVTVQLADGTYTQEPVLSRFAGGGSVVISGNSATPANVVLVGDMAVRAQFVTVQNFSIQGTTFGLYAQQGANVMFGAGMRFGTSSAAQITALDNSLITITQNYAIYGAAVRHLLASRGGRIRLFTTTVTITNSPAFTIFADADLQALIETGSTAFSGVVTGSRYRAQYVSAIFTNGGGANYFPGNSVGTVANGGVYG
jgi:hypothetical protein